MVNRWGSGHKISETAWKPPIIVIIHRELWERITYETTTAEEKWFSLLVRHDGKGEENKYNPCMHATKMVLSLSWPQGYLYLWPLSGLWDPRRNCAFSSPGVEFCIFPSLKPGPGLQCPVYYHCLSSRSNWIQNPVVLCFRILTGSVCNSREKTF